MLILKDLLKETQSGAIECWNSVIQHVLFVLVCENILELTAESRYRRVEHCLLEDWCMTARWWNQVPNMIHVLMTSNMLGWQENIHSTLYKCVCWWDICYDKTWETWILLKLYGRTVTRGYSFCPAVLIDRKNCIHSRQHSIILSQTKTWIKYFSNWDYLSETFEIFSSDYCSISLYCERFCSSEQMKLVENIRVGSSSLVNIFKMSNGSVLLCFYESGL